MSDGGILRSSLKFRSHDGRSPAAGKSSSVPPDPRGGTRKTLGTWRAAARIKWNNYTAGTADELRVRIR